LLVQLGAVVSAADPHVSDDMTPPGVRRVAGDAADLAEADAVLLLVDHPEFDFTALEGLDAYVLDCRRVTGSTNVELL
jgi:UDP-N-acetyl-D-glucosamine dehydrogenase